MISTFLCVRAAYAVCEEYRYHRAIRELVRTTEFDCLIHEIFHLHGPAVLRKVDLIQRDLQFRMCRAAERNVGIYEVDEHCLADVRRREGDSFEVAEVLVDAFELAFDFEFLVEEVSRGDV